MTAGLSILQAKRRIRSFIFPDVAVWTSPSRHNSRASSGSNGAASVTAALHRRFPLAAVVSASSSAHDGKLSSIIDPMERPLANPRFPSARCSWSSSVIVRRDIRFTHIWCLGAFALVASELLKPGQAFRRFVHAPEWYHPRRHQLRGAGGEPNQMSKILQGIRVLDFGRYIAGPYCATLLGDMGAEVIRIEKVDGSEDRYLSPITENRGWRAVPATCPQQAIDDAQSDETGGPRDCEEARGHGGRGGRQSAA